MKRCPIISLLVFIVNLNFLQGQSFQFIRESIDIVIGDKYAAVTGIYYFRNNFNQEITKPIFYPFPINNILPYPDSIRVFDLKDNLIHFNKSSNGIHFTVYVPADSEISIKVKYSQKLLSNEMMYILKTTQNWKHPLLKAEYKISILKEFELKEISLEPYNRESNSSYNIFYIYKENFMPIDDLIIKWEGGE